MPLCGWPLALTSHRIRHSTCTRGGAIGRAEVPGAVHAIVRLQHVLALPLLQQQQAPLTLVALALGILKILLVLMIMVMVKMVKRR